MLSLLCSELIYRFQSKSMLLESKLCDILLSESSKVAGYLELLWTYTHGLYLEWYENYWQG